MKRRRLQLEMLVCALLVAALAVQPAVGGGKPNGTGKPAAGTAKGAKNVNGLIAAKAAGAKRPTRAAKARAAQDAGPPATAAAPAPQAAVAPTAAPAESGGASPPVATPAAAPEEGPPAAAPAPPAATPPAAPAATPSAAPAAEEAGTPSRGAGAPSEGARAAGAEANAIAPPPAAAAPPPAAAPVTAPAAPAAGDPAAGAAAGAGAAAPAAGPAAGTATPRLQAPRLRAAGRSLTLVQLEAALPGAAIRTPLVTPATEAITRARPGRDVETSAPRPAAGDNVPALQGAAEAGANDTSVAEVLVEWAQYALVVLALLVLVLGVNSIVQAARTRRLERQRVRLMEDVGLLQEALLPAVPARLGALLTTVAYRPADGPAGGDFYDAFALPDGRVGLLLGDVSGHGRQALAKTTLVRFTVRAHLEAGLSPREAIAIAGRSLDGRLSDDFATVIAAIHDPVKNTLTYASAGHPPPIVAGPSRHEPVTVSSAPPIGVGFPTGQRQTVLPMPEGSSVMIYSDGLLEARIDGVPVGPERLAAWLAELGPEATAKALLDRVVTHADRVPDDLAAVLVHASSGATAPAARIEQLKLDVLDMDGPDLDGFLRAAGVGEADRLIAGRRVSELLASASGVIVEVRTGEHPMVSVAPIGDDAALSARQGARTR